MSTKTLKAPFPYFGGKSRVAPMVWERLGCPANYVEPFLGSGANILARPHWQGKVETVNDADGFLANFWRSLKMAPLEVAKWCDYPVSELDLHARHSWLVAEGLKATERLRADPDFFDVKVAAWWVWGISLWIGDGWCSGAANVRQLPHVGGAGRGVHRAPRQMPALSSAGMGTHSASKRIPHLSDAGTGVARSSIADMGTYFEQLAARLARVRVCCGDWSRIVTPSVTTGIGLTGVFLDPPYGQGNIEYGNGGNGCESVAASVRAWCVKNGGDPLLRVALCGYEGQGHEVLEAHGWRVVEWLAAGGYGSQGQGEGRKNAKRERIWFSPHCLGVSQKGLFE